MSRRWSPSVDTTAGGVPPSGVAAPAGAGLHGAETALVHDGGIAAGCGGVFVPTGYEPGYAYPLLVWLPDPRRSSFDLGRTMARVSLRNHVAVRPLRADGDADDEAAVWRAIDRVRDVLSIHPGRVFLVGQGRGGTEAFRIACRHAGAFAGVVSLGGAFPHGERALGRLADVRRLPMLLCCRKDSPPALVRSTEATLRLFHAAGANLAMRIYPGRAETSRLVLADVNRWLMDEICGAPSDRQVACG